jgi:hypothetical protein
MDLMEDDGMLIRPFKDIPKLLHTVKTQGVFRAAKLATEAIADRIDQRFDQIHGVETHQSVKLSQLGFRLEDQRRYGDYSASPVRTVRVLLSSLPPDLNSFTFIDFGSGKGRALLVASEYRFRRIIGVEFSNELHQIAEANLRFYRGGRQRCLPLSSVCGRAEEFLPPAGDLVLYFYNPFEPEVMERVLQNVTAAWERTPRHINLLFIRMRFRPIVKRLGIFRKIRVPRLPFDPARPSGCDAAILVTEPNA